MLSLTWSCERIGSILLPHGVFAGTDVFFLSAAAAAHDVHVHATFCPFATFAMAEAEAKARAEAEKAKARRLKPLWGVSTSTALLSLTGSCERIGCVLLSHSASWLARTCSS